MYNYVSGCFEHWRKRNNIRLTVLCGESGDVCEETVEDWKKRLPSIIEGYAPKDRFNADETGVFYREMPKKSHVQKGASTNGV